MNYEKLYKEALERARGMWEQGMMPERIEYIFPELKESEDEKMIIAIKEAVSNYWSDDSQAKTDILAWLEKQGEKLPVGFYYVNSEGKKFYSDTFKYGDVILHVEKQGEQKETLCDKCKREQSSHSCQDITELGRCAIEHEQKPADKVEPKFAIGDWVVPNIRGGGELLHIIDKDGENYKVETTQDEMLVPSIEYVDAYYHLFTIQDAKDGDVLYSPEFNLLWIYKNKEEYYAAVNLNYANTIHYGSNITIPSDVCPATKEQRDKLEKAITEAGYEWDSEKKELKKIEL